jgi:hypothetical protein
MKGLLFSFRTGLFAAILLTTTAFAVIPRGYVGLASVGAAGGYHGWRLEPVRGTGNAWWNVNGAGLEGRLILDNGLGFGMRMIDGAGVILQDEDWELQFFRTTYAEFSPSILWVVHHDHHGFGFIELQLMPYIRQSLLYNTGYASGAALDYAYVPWAPVPIETHVRLAGTVFDWNPVTSPIQIGYQASAGIRIGLGWWFMPRPTVFRL